MGRPKKPIDPEQVRKLAMLHCTIEEIAFVMGCSRDTLERRYRDVIEQGKAQGKASLRKLQRDLAEKGNAAMAIWLGKQQLDQKEPHQVIHNKNEEIPAKKMTDTELDARIEALLAKKNVGEEE